jgi:hypothetical protein
MQSAGDIPRTTRANLIELIIWSIPFCELTDFGQTRRPQRFVNLGISLIKQPREKARLSGNLFLRL